MYKRQVFYPKDYNKSRSLDLGLRFATEIGDGIIGTPNTDVDRVAIFLRVDWNWFRQ